MEVVVPNDFSPVAQYATPYEHEVQEERSSDFYHFHLAGLVALVVRLLLHPSQDLQRLVPPSH